MPIRLATTADQTRLLAIDGGAKRDPSHPAWLREAIASRSAWKLLSLGEIVAYGVLRRSFFNRWFVESLYVSVAHRQLGHGSRLLAFFEKRAAPSQEIWISTNRSNRSMRGMLRKCGYVRCGQVGQLDYGDPEVFFRKRL